MSGINLAKQRGLKMSPQLTESLVSGVGEIEKGEGGPGDTPSERQITERRITERRIT
jgi:hypothetical protein